MNFAEKTSVPVSRSRSEIEGIENVIYLCDRIEALTVEWNELAPKAARFDKVREEHAATKEELRKLLRAMDVDKPGNFGWEDRMAWALCEMRRQVGGRT